MASFNQVIIIGGLTKDPEKIPAKVEMAKFSVAFDSGFGDRKQTEYLDVICFKGQAESVLKCLVKGARVQVSGELKSDTWEPKDGGAKRKSWEITARDITFLSPPKDSSGGGGGDSAASSGSGDASSEDDDDDGIPF